MRDRGSFSLLLAEMCEAPIPLLNTGKARLLAHIYLYNLGLLSASTAHDSIDVRSSFPSKRPSTVRRQVSQ